jgi:hypothetical protein
MLTREEILDFLKSHKEYFREHFDVANIGIFGSFARDEQNEHSDIDVIVQFNKGATDLFEKRLDLKEYLQFQLGRQVDICHKYAIKPVFRDLIFNEAIYA